MQGRQGGDRMRQARVVIVGPAPAQLQDAFAAAQQGLGRHATHQQQQLGLQDLDLPLQERLAGGDLAGRRIAVPGRAPVQQVGDVDLAAVEADGRQHAIEKLAGGTDEGLALAVLLAARRLADDHEAGFGVAVVEAEVGRRGLQRAAFEGLQRLADRSEEHTSELQSLMRISYAVFCLKKKIKWNTTSAYHKFVSHNLTPMLYT